ncbi:hypothetical protein JCM5296_006666 [Sporobolomyces johnsonii]
MPSSKSDPAAATPDKATSSAPPPKKPRVKRVKGRKGALQVFNALPLDLLYEICSNLDSADLFALSNTSKVLRAAVTGPSSKQLWIDARARIGLPELEVPLDDLAYAQLMHGKGCTFCDRKQAGKPDPFFRARICSACLKLHFASNDSAHGNAALHRITDRDLHPLTLSCVNYTAPHGRNGRHFYLPEVKKVNAELLVKFPPSEITWQDRLFASDAFAGFDNIGEPSTPFEAWYAEGSKAREARKRDGHAISDWIKKQELAKSMSKDDIRKVRRQDIEARFAKQGFEAYEFRSVAWSQNAMLRKPEHLTERMWTNKVEPVLKQVLLTERKAWRRSEFSEVYYDLRRQHAQGNYFPSAELFLNLATVRPLLDDVSHNTPACQLFKQHRCAIVGELEGLLRDRREGMVRAIGQAYLAARDMQASQLAAGTLSASNAPQDGPHNLDEVVIDFPRLPPWIPRSDDAPLLGEDEQIITFLDNSPLANFECAHCNRFFDHAGILSHVASPYRCVAEQDAKDMNLWARIRGRGGFDTAPIKIDADIMMLALKLKQIVSRTPFDVSAADARYDAHGTGEIDVPEAEKYFVLLNCACGVRGWDIGPGRHMTVADAFYHCRRGHSAPHHPRTNISGKSFYTSALSRELKKQAALEGNPHYDPFGYGDEFDCPGMFDDSDLDGFGHDMHDYDMHGYDGFDYRMHDMYDSDTGMPMYGPYYEYGLESEEDEESEADERCTVM